MRPEFKTRVPIYAPCACMCVCMYVCVLCVSSSEEDLNASEFKTQVHIYAPYACMCVYVCVLREEDTPWICIYTYKCIHVYT